MAKTPPVHTTPNGGGWVNKRAIDLLSVLTLLAISLVSCTDTSSTEPSQRPSFSGGGIAAPTYSVTLTPTASNQDVGPLTLGDYQYPTLGVVEVTGILDQYYSQATRWIFPPPTGDLRGTLAGQMDAGGQWQTSQCYARVMVIFSQGGGEAFCDAYNQKSIISVWSDTSVMKGTGTARWYKGPASFSSNCDGAGKPPCYTYDGTHVVTVTPVQASLLVVPTRYVTHPGKSSVTFRARRTPSTFGSHVVPLAVQNWTWEPDSGSGVGPSCGTDTTCVFAPVASGTMTVTALVNGTIQSQSVHIRVLCAATGRPDLDSLPLLDAMSAAFDSAWNADPTLRRERGWSVDCLDGMCVPMVHPVPPGTTPCTTLWPSGSSTGATRVGDGHVHPFVPGELSTDTLPNSCRDPDKQYPPGIPIQSAAGPSRHDRRTAREMQLTGWNHCIIEPNRIHCFPMNNPDSKWSMPRQVNGCTIAIAPKDNFVEETA